MRARGPPADADDSIAAHLMRITDPNTGQLLSDESLLPQVSVLFWAGFDTTGNTMAWTLYCISQHPEVSCATVKHDQALKLKVQIAALRHYSWQKHWCHGNACSQVLAAFLTCPTAAKD